MNNPNQLKTGGDPRSLPDYAALRDELTKLNHPARPDVDWCYVEKLCLSLFEQNGVELQTAAWYTLARMRLAGLLGLNEGLTILEEQISHQWGLLWPQPVHARMEILGGLSQRLQQQMRTLSLNYSDLSQLYRAEQLLGKLVAVLQRLELKHLSQFDTLRALMHNSAARLEKKSGVSEPDTAIQPDIIPSVTTPNDADLQSDAFPSVIPSKDAEVSAEGLHSLPAAKREQSTSTAPQLEETTPKPQARAKQRVTNPAPEKKWHFFAAGMATMLVISAVSVWGWHWHSLQQPQPSPGQPVTSRLAIPDSLAVLQKETLLKQKTLPQAMIEEIRQQFSDLDKLPPDWDLVYSRQLLEQLQTHWPEQAKPFTLQYQQMLNTNALPAKDLLGWHQGMSVLQKLSERLNGLDEQKGKYITVSELKSVMFAAMQSFNQAVPVEEQLRVLSALPKGQPLPSAASAQIDIQLKQLIIYYSEIKQKATQ